MQHILKMVIIPFIILPVFFKTIEEWIFEYTSRIIELFNAWSLTGFGIIMLSNSADLLKLKVYGNFVQVPAYVWICMIMIGLMQFILLCRTCNKSHQLGAITLQLSAVIWSVIAMASGLQSPISTALPVYSGMSIVFGLTGYGVLRASKEIEG